MNAPRKVQSSKSEVSLLSKVPIHFEYDKRITEVRSRFTTHNRRKK